MTGLLQDFRIHHKEFSEAMKVGKQALEREDYPAAFAGFKRASELDPIDHRAQEQETKAAMLWLENARATANQSFTDTVSQLLPVLDRGLANAKGPAAADILAHIGLANFLRYREAVREGVNVEESLQRALSIDKTNPYANAIFGFWILWQGGSNDAASPYFATALASGRERTYVRQLQIAALTDTSQRAADTALLRVANEMRKNGETLSRPLRREVLRCVVDVRVMDHSNAVTFLSTLPPEDTVATYDWLYDPDNDPWDYQKALRPYIVANLSEMGGNRAPALLIYQTLQASLAGTQNTLRPKVDEAVRRVEAKRIR